MREKQNEDDKCLQTEKDTHQRNGRLTTNKLIHTLEGQHDFAREIIQRQDVEFI